MTLHHYGFATANLQASADAYSSLGYEKVTEVITDPIQNVKLLFLQRRGEPLVELVEPLSAASPVSNILQKNGPTLYHSCYEVSDIEETIKDLRKKGFVVIVKPVAAIAFDNRPISFLYNKHIGLIELLQSER